MQHTSPAACLSCELLRFVRDEEPTVAELIEQLGGEREIGRYHVLRKAGLITVIDDRVRLAESHLNHDRTIFTYEISLYHIDENVTSTIRRARP